MLLVFFKCLVILGYQVSLNKVAWEAWVGFFRWGVGSSAYHRPPCKWKDNVGGAHCVVGFSLGVVNLRDLPVRYM